MKLKNVRVGDKIQAKVDIYGGTIEKGEIVEVKSVEPVNYDGELTIHVSFRCRSTWVNHNDFRKTPQDGESE